MNKHVNDIAGRLSLRPPQRKSLEILDRVAEILDLQGDIDPAAALNILHSEFATVTDFEREFPSLCFALATGVGKTRLMGAFITYLHLAHGINNFFVLAPNLTIYNKLIADFTPNTSKYVFKGINRFASEPPELITGDNYENRSTLLSDLITCKINIFNISKINSEVRGGKEPRMKRPREIFGESYFDYLADLKDLVILMDESHRYRASAGVRAINELKPLLGLELTATPFMETTKGPVQFKNVIFDYPLGQALEDGFVKEPAVVTRKDFSALKKGGEEIERIKLEDGLKMHEIVKVELETYARENDKPIVKPFMLVIARDTTHAAQLVKLISEELFGGVYAGKVIQVDSSKTGAEEDEMVARLLNVERADEPTEVVVHVNMLKEGWDVTNLYTIVPLRAANARILIEQSIGRGLRLPYGKRTGVPAVDQLNIVAHDKFQEIVDEANRPDSRIRLKQIIMTEEGEQAKTVSHVAQPLVDQLLGIVPPGQPVAPQPGVHVPTPAFTTVADQEVAKIAHKVMHNLATQRGVVATSNDLLNPAVLAKVVAAVQRDYRPAQQELAGVSKPDIVAIVGKTATIVVQGTIDIPRIVVTPADEVRTGFRHFKLDLTGLNYQPPSQDLYKQTLRTGVGTTLTFATDDNETKRLETIIIEKLMDFDDVDYDQHADLLYDLAMEVVAHFASKHDGQAVRRIVTVHAREIAKFIYVQMTTHFWEETGKSIVEIKAGFTPLKGTAYTAQDGKPPLNFRHQPPDKTKIASYVFGNFARCLYATQKFQSDTERVLAIVLDREAQKWLRPAKGQFLIFYRWDGGQPEYVPDFVAETADCIYMLEPKARKDLNDGEVLAKRDVAVTWCKHASDYSMANGGKPWRYLLIPHDEVAENRSLSGLAGQFGQK